MIISVNWLKKFTDIDLPIDELATLIGARLVEIEEVIDLGAKYKDVVVARVVECGKLENSDHLNVTKLDDGGVVRDVERDENGLVQVVCGAPNVRAGLLVAWLPPNSVVPETYGSDEPFVLGARKLRGVMSNGMIASAKELDLFDDHTGILELDKDVQPGGSFAEAYELNDYLLDIENKSLTHRPDTFGIIGFAREVAAIQGKAFETPVWLKELATPDYDADAVEVPTVTIDDPALSDRYQAVVLGAADGSAQSPLQVQTYLSRVGVRPISAVVDVTNYLMMLTGQPLHAFDYDKLVKAGGGRADVHVRSGRDGETLKLLDGRTIELSPADIVIVAGDTPVGLAGAMGGEDTEIDDETKNIILESATFNLYNLRATQMRHGIFSEAITRFTKGQPAELTAPVLSQAVQLMGEYAGAVPVTKVVESYPGNHEPTVLRVTVDQVNETLGSQFMAADVVEILQNVEFSADIEDEGTIVVTAPYWRADIHISEDVIEEVGRLSGFDHITPTLPRRDFTAVRPSDFDELRTRVRKSLVRAGANEVLTYSFIHGDAMRKAGQNPDDSYRITNSISPDLQYYRQTLTPNLLGLTHPNIKNGFEEFALFELNKAHRKSAGTDAEDVPQEHNFAALTFASKKTKRGAAYYEAKTYLENLTRGFGMTLAYSPLDPEAASPLTQPFEVRRSATVTDVASGEFLGVVGEYKKSVARNFKLPEHAAGFEIDTDALLRASRANGTHYVPLSRYPSAERDICFQVEESVSYAQVAGAVTAALATTGLETVVIPIDIYQPEGGDKKNVTVRIRLTSHDHTLSGEEVSTVIGNVASHVVGQTLAVVI